MRRASTEKHLMTAVGSTVNTAHSVRPHMLVLLMQGGVTILFDKIEVVNRLKREHVYDTIKEYGVHYDKTWIYGRSMLQVSDN